MQNLGFFYDTETTGLPLFREPSEHPGQPHLVQLAAALVDLDTRETVASLDVVVRPTAGPFPTTSPRSTASPPTTRRPSACPNRSPCRCSWKCGVGACALPTTSNSTPGLSESPSTAPASWTLIWIAGRSAQPNARRAWPRPSCSCRPRPRWWRPAAITSRRPTWARPSSSSPASRWRTPTTPWPTSGLHGRLLRHPRPPAGGLTMHAYLNRRERRMALRIESRRQTRARRIERPRPPR